MNGWIQVKMGWEFVINELNGCYSLHDSKKFNNIRQWKANLQNYTYIIILFFFFLVHEIMVLSYTMLSKYVTYIYEEVLLVMPT